MIRIFWDTNLFIYYLEDFGEPSQLVDVVARRMRERNDRLYTSFFTLGEALVKPTEREDEHLCARIEEYIVRYTELIPFTRTTARLYARIRKLGAVKPPDAIQLACAAQEEMDIFVTNDERLSKKIIPGIKLIVSLKQAAEVL